MNEMAISVEEGEHGPHVLVAGDLDLSAGDALEAIVAPMLRSGAEVEVEMRRVAFVDSSGLGALLALSQLAEDEGSGFVLRDPSEAVVKALDLTQTADMFTVKPPH